MKSVVTKASRFLSRERDPSEKNTRTKAPTQWTEAGVVRICGCAAHRVRRADSESETEAEAESGTEAEGKRSHFPSSPAKLGL